MEIPALARLAYQRFILSSRYEDDLDFRTIMGHHVNRGVGLIGGLFPAIRAARQPVAQALREL